MTTTPAIKAKMDKYAKDIGVGVGHHLLRDMTVGDEGLAYYLEHHANPQKTTGLGFSDCGLSDSAVEMLVDYLQDASGLKLLNIANPFSLDASEKLLEAVAKHGHITSLEINPSAFAGHMDRFHSLMQALPPMQYLKLIHINLKGEDLKKLAETCSALPYIENLQVDFDTPDKEGMYQAASHIAQYQLHAKQFSFSGKDVPLDSFNAAYEKSASVNLMMPYGSVSSYIKRLTQQNGQTLSTLITPVRSRCFGSLSALELQQIESRPHVFKDLCSMFGQRGIETVKQSYAEELQKMPVLPSALRISQLFNANEHGYALLDNPRLWPSTERARNVLKLAATDPSCLSQQTKKGGSLLLSLSGALPLRGIIQTLNERNIRITPDLLLDKNGQPTHFFTNIIQRHQGYDLFTPANWTGQSKDDLRNCYAHLPDYQKDKVRLHQMIAKLPGPDHHYVHSR